MVKELAIIEKASHKKRLPHSVRSRVFEVVGPYRMRERWEEITSLPLFLEKEVWSRFQK